MPKANELALIEPPPANSWIFAYTRWDAIPVAGGDFTLRLFLQHVLSFSAYSTLGDADSRFCLLDHHLVEHQRHFSQLHSQSVFPFAAAEPVVQYHRINHRRL